MAASKSTAETDKEKKPIYRMEVRSMTATGTAGSTIPDLLRARCQEQPERAAIIMDGTVSLTFGDWERRSSAVAGVLHQAKDVKRGQCVGLFFDNHEWIEYAIAYCAVLKAGAAAVHLGPHMAVSEVQRDGTSTVMWLA